MTGAPKAWAMQFIEDHERSSRAWYGGAVGLIGFDGNLNTGLTLRTIRVKDGVAEVRAGATLLYDSDPEAEEEETELKASAFLDAIRRPDGAERARAIGRAAPGAGKRVLLVDHQDSFVHTLANYLRQTGAEVVTLRPASPPTTFDDAAAASGRALARARARRATSTSRARSTRWSAARIPMFGVCLGLQGMVEYFGGTLGVLDPRCTASPRGSASWAGASSRACRRVHAPAAITRSSRSATTLPAVLDVTAESDDGVVMAIEHATLPLAAVQFHPESIMTLGDDVGLRLLANVVACLAAPELPRCRRRSRFGGR